MSIKKEVLCKNLNGDLAYCFRIPNQTGDYVELTNLGCQIRGIHVHKLDGTMENVASVSSGTLWGSEIGKILSEKLWSIAEEGDNNVFLTYESLANENAYHTDIQLGVNVSWVNLNRLIIDFFLTPKKKICIDFSTTLNIVNNNRKFAIRSFCPIVENVSGDRYEVQETEYKDMNFVMLTEHSDLFLHPNDEIKPMIELSDRLGSLRISSYSTLSCVRIESSSSGANDKKLSIVCSGENPIELNADETLANRMIFGFDYIEDTMPDDAEPNPFSFFL